MLRCCTKPSRCWLSTSRLPALSRLAAVGQKPSKCLWSPTKAFNLIVSFPFARKPVPLFPTVSFFCKTQPTNQRLSPTKGRLRPMKCPTSQLRFKPLELLLHESQRLLQLILPRPGKTLQPPSQVLNPRWCEGGVNAKKQLLIHCQMGFFGVS